MATYEGAADVPVDYALHAFVNGYAIHGVVPAPTRARKALATAQAVLNEHQDVSTLSVIEAQGTLEGLYSNIYVRRDRLWLKYDRRSKIWAARLALDVPYESLVTTIQSQVDLAVHEATADQRADIRKIVLAALADTLTRYGDLASEARSLAAAAQAEGTALGIAAAAALLAFIAGHPVPDMDTLQKQSLTQLQQEHTYGDNANEIVSAMLGGLAGDVARGLPQHIVNGQPDDNMATYVQSIIAAGVGSAFYLDNYIHAAFALALLAAYKAANVMVDFVTVGDARVCPACEAAEDGNPYTPDSVPPIPEHGGCRCWYAPAS